MSSTDKPIKKIVFFSFPELTQEEVNELFGSIGKALEIAKIDLPYRVVAVAEKMHTLTLDEVKEYFTSVVTALSKAAAEAAAHR
jgi:hypothetical protein